MGDDGGRTRGRPRPGNFDTGRLMFEARQSLRATISQVRMSQLLGLSDDTVGRWEKGEIKPLIDELKAYCAVLLKKGAEERVVVEIFKRYYPSIPFRAASLQANTLLSTYQFEGTPRVVISGWKLDDGKFASHPADLAAYRLLQGI